MRPRRWYNVTLISFMVLLLTGCSLFKTATKSYERHKEVAYTKDGTPRTDGYFLNTPFLDALDADLQACYARKNP